MIKLDPEEEGEEDDQQHAKTPQKTQMLPPNTSNAYPNDVTMNHQYANNVPITLPRVNLPAVVEPQQIFVSCSKSLQDLEL